MHFEAPPSIHVPDEMKQFVTWFNDTAPGGKTPLPPLTRVGIAYLKILKTFNKNVFC